VQIGLVPANTGGTGGAAGLRTEKFSDGASETNFFVYTPTGAGPFGVLVFFHGDGGSPTAANFAKSTAVQAFANSDRYIVVEAAAPDGSSWWMQGGKNNAALIDAFLRTKIFKAYDVTTKKVTFAGMSGGANFIGGFLLPERGHKFRSLSILLCGGEQNIGDIFYTHEEFPKNSRLYVKIKRGDDLFDQAQRALDYYKLKGFKVTADLLDGTGHCGFNIVDAVAAAIRADR
jgi:predicted esterase